MSKKQNSTPFHYGEDTLTVKTALELAHSQRQGLLSEKALPKIRASWQAVQDIVKSGRTVYSINTGFGALCRVAISAEDTKKLQDNILRSHSVGVGENVPDEISLLMLVLKIHALALGYSGVAIETLERIQWHIDNRIVPLVPCQGSVGASGDLAPLAHLFLPLIGLGKVSVNGVIKDTAEVFKEFNLAPLSLGPKEGLALINGTQFIQAFAIKAVERFNNLLDASDIIGALSLESMLGSDKPFDAKLHDLRPFPGAKHVAFRLRALLKNSELVISHQDCDRVQDPYSLRCMPQVHGASRDAWLHLKTQLDVEINSVTDNPVIFSAEDTVSGGNFHGQPLALPLDYLALAASEIGNISDRRTYLLLEGKVRGLPMLLMKNTGINSGFMIPQYTSAALVSENKSLCYPASADSIPTSLGQEDHVSMGSISGRKACRILDNLENILAIEALSAAQAFDFHRPLKSSKILEAVHAGIRALIPHVEEDRVFSDDIALMRDFIASKKLVTTAHASAAATKIDLNGDQDERFGLH